jgi:hypothetical protein
MKTYDNRWENSIAFEGEDERIECVLNKGNETLTVATMTMEGDDIQATTFTHDQAEALCTLLTTYLGR